MLRGLFKLRDAARRGAIEIPEMMLKPMTVASQTMPGGSGRTFSPGTGRHRGFRNISSRGAAAAPAAPYTPNAMPSYGGGYESVTMPGGSGRTFSPGTGRHRGFRNISPRTAGAAPAAPYTPYATPSYGGGYETVTMSGGSGSPRAAGAAAAAPSTPPINKVASTNAPIKPQWSAWGAVPLTMMAGGMTANLFSSEENRGLGTFAKGALFGAGGGLGMHMAMGSGALGKATAMARAMAVKGGHSTTASWAGSAHRMARMAQSQESRAVAWGAGAMLAGTLGGSSKSKAHGINGNRGNRFGG